MPVSYELQPGLQRMRLCLTVQAVLLLCAWRALPVEFFAYVLVLLHHLPVIRSLETPAVLRFDAGDWWQVWMSQAAVCVYTHAHSRVWVFRDELSPRDWAALRRYLRLYTPRTPWGLSISR